MGDIINLNKARKNRDKSVKETQAKQNRLTYGQKKSEKKSGQSSRAKASKELDNHKLGHEDEV